MKNKVLESFLSKATDGDPRLKKILEDLLKEDKLLSKSDVDESKILKIYELKNVDTLETKIMDDGSVKIDIKKRRKFKRS